MTNNILMRTIKNIGYYLASLTYKRDKKVILIGSWFGEKFADNSRFLFQYLSENKEEAGIKQVVWVTRSEKVLNVVKQFGYEVYMMDSKESIFYHKHAGVHIICNSSGDDNRGDILGQYSYGAICINLWHGIGLKRTGWISNYSLKMLSEKPFVWGLKKRLELNNRFYNTICLSSGGWSRSYILTTTEYVNDIFGEIFLKPDRLLIQSGYPRHCIDVKLTEDEQTVIKKIKSYDKRVLYLPTFRKKGKEVDMLYEVDGQLNTLLKRENTLWIQKMHSAGNNNTNMSSSENVLWLEDSFDINILLPHVSILVTDYSSVMSDAIYFDIPVMFYVPDFYEYLNDDNGLREEDVDYFCGTLSFERNEFREALEKGLKDPEGIKSPVYKKMKKMYWDGKTELSDIWKDISKVIYSKGEQK